MDAHTPHAGFRGKRADHRGGRVAVARGRTLGHKWRKEPFARGADEHGVPKRGQLVEVRQQLPPLLGSLVDLGICRRMTLMPELCSSETAGVLNELGCEVQLLDGSMPCAEADA